MPCQKDSEEEKKLCTTQDIDLAAYLNAKGVQFAGTQRINGSQNMRFLFIHPDKKMMRFSWNGSTGIWERVSCGVSTTSGKDYSAGPEQQEGAILDHDWQKYEPK